MNRLVGPIAVALAAAGLGLCAQMSRAQVWPPGPAAPPNPGYQSQVCQRLEAQLATIDRGATDPAQAEQVRRYEDAVSRQQAEIDRMTARAQRAGCDSGFFLFRSDSPQCVDLNRQIQSMRGNLDRMTMDLQRVRGGNIDRGEQRRTILTALGENNCGPQYRQAARGGFFDQIFGNLNGTPSDSPGNTFRTVCVRTCDGYYFPISYATTPDRFRDDEKTCQRQCPAAEVVLFSHPSPGGDINQAVSLSGQLYTALPNAFHYRQEMTAACSCRRPGQSWADALGPDTTLQSGDVVVTEDRAKAMAAPLGVKPAQVKATPAAPNAAPATADAPADATATDAPASDTPAKKTVRSVGPVFISPTAAVSTKK